MSNDIGWSLSDVYELLTDPDFKNAKSLVSQEMAYLGGSARSAAALVTQSAEETVGGIMANAFSHMRWLESYAMREMLESSDFSPLDINNGRTTVYFVLPPELLGVHQRALRLMVTTFVAAAMKGRKTRGKPATLFEIDEAFAIGALDILTKAAALLRGFGARARLFFQNIGQIRELYGRNAETFFANAGQVQFFGLNDKEGCDYVSDRLGKRRLWRKRKMQTKEGVRVEWEPAGTAPLRDGPEIAQMLGRNGRLQIVTCEGELPFLLRRTSYRDMFPPDQYAQDPMEPPERSWKRDLWWLERTLLKKLKELMK
jgi:type IV secretory pathway TraG/TraD family ATPase VirD4